MSLPEQLPIVPFTLPATGDVRVPGSKSLTNRALLLAALAHGRTVLSGALFSEDTEIMAEALRQLGFEVTADAAAQTLTVEGRGGDIPAAEADLFVGLAGTAARFLTALCAAAPRGRFRLDGTEQMRKRPMRGLIDALRALGADLRCPGREYHFPLEIHARGLNGGPVSIDASESSQMLSALLLVAPLARAEVSISLSAPVREPFVQLTRELQRRFGATPANPVRHYAIEPDATAASYFLALPVAAFGSLQVRNVGAGLMQGDIAFAAVLREAGVALADPPGGLVSRCRADTPLRGVARDFSGLSDTFLTLAAIAPLLSGPTRISGIAHTRRQETDRVAGAANELRRLGQEVVETDDALEIHPRPLRRDQTIETYGDHRFAMSFAVLGCRDAGGDGQPWLSIRHPACCAKTFPDFFERLDQVRSRALRPL
ncbi:MAG TPA: 3-phosphoshikimate 1-carboxyvinyltransferase [Opitutaceae bacterium]|jgi:3-phosphoshikimate 1-carboxyvinyltransferase